MIPDNKLRTYDQLLSSGYPLSWAVLQAAANGGLILDEQIKDYAIDHLGIYDDLRNWIENEETTLGMRWR